MIARTGLPQEFGRGNPRVWPGLTKEAPAFQEVGNHPWRDQPGLRSAAQPRPHFGHAGAKILRQASLAPSSCLHEEGKRE
jgi:hypothetical protein